MTFSQKIKELRTSRNMSQSEFAKAIGVHARQISKYETKSIIPNTETLIKISKLFDVSLDYLVFNNVESKETPEIVSYELLGRLSKIEKLSIKDKETIINVLDAFIERSTPE